MDEAMESELGTATRAIEESFKRMAAARAASEKGACVGCVSCIGSTINSRHKRSVTI